MKLCIGLHNSGAGTGLSRRINLLSSRPLSGGQTSRYGPWSPGSINHDRKRQKWCHTQHARRSTYQSPCLQGWRVPWRWMSLINLNDAVTHRDLHKSNGGQDVRCRLQVLLNVKTPLASYQQTCVWWNRSFHGHWRITSLSFLCSSFEGLRLLLYEMAWPDI